MFSRRCLWRFARLSYCGYLNSLQATAKLYRADIVAADCISNPRIQNDSLALKVLLD